MLFGGKIISDNIQLSVIKLDNLNIYHLTSRKKFLEFPIYFVKLWERKEEKMKNKQDECTQILYGIHSTTFEVQSISVYRSGRMLGNRSHTPQQGKDARTEAAIVFNLGHIISITPILHDSADAKKQIEQLQKKAAELKEEASKNTTSSNTAPSTTTSSSSGNP